MTNTTNIESALRDYGGIARLSELMSRGYGADYVSMASEYGRILRVRKGWYANLDIDESVIRAVRVGGRLGCVSALQFHGMVTVEASQLHVSVPRNASRLRTPASHKIRLAGSGAASDVVIHWNHSLQINNRQAVTPSEALSQAWACQWQLRAMAAGGTAAEGSTAEAPQMLVRDTL